jgi:hypothetical protein
MGLADLFHFFLGDADTIRRLAANPWTLAVGAVLVLSAGLARNYDTHDLRAQWWRLLLPFAASTAAAGVLFFVVAALIRLGVPLAPLGWGILGLFWLTAPLAWLYGSPFERYLAPVPARRARLGALGVVSVCRVALMTRCVSVLCGCDWREALLSVVCFAVPTALLAVGAALLLVRKPEVGHVEADLGGVGQLADRLLARKAEAGDGSSAPAPAAESPVTKAARKVVDAMAVIRGLDWPKHAPPQPPKGFAPAERAEWKRGNRVAGGVALGLLAGALLLAVSCLLPWEVDWGKRWRPTGLEADTAPPSPGVWGFAAAAVLWWAYWLLARQPAHFRRTMFARRLQAEDVPGAVRDLAALRPEDLPPHWDPSAPLAWTEYSSRLLEAAVVASDLPKTCWIRTHFLRRVEGLVPLWVDSEEIWLFQKDRMTAEQLQDLLRLRELLRKLPHGAEILRTHRDYLEAMCEYTRERDPPRHELLQDLLALALRSR